MKTSFNPLKIEPLAGDASLRSFYRLFLKDGTTVIKMLTPAEQCEDHEKYLQILKFFQANSLPVPGLLEADERELAIYLEDLGDKDYYQIHSEIDAEARFKWYREFIGVIARIGALKNDFKNDIHLNIEILGYDRLLWELNYFLEQYLIFRNIILSDSDLKRIRSWFESLASRISRFPTTLCHRDFHSKNIMIRNNSPYLVDFQDTRIGPYNYDLASLIWDSYVSLDENLINEMQDYYYNHLELLEIRINSEDYRIQNRLTALQRNIKAIGTFASQSNKGNRNYIHFIQPTWEKVFQHLRFINKDNLTESILSKLASI